MNPSYLIYNTDGTQLYAALESGSQPGGTGAVAAYAVDGMNLRLINIQPIGAFGPCHLHIFENTLYAACYGGGALCALPLGADGELLPAQALYYPDVPAAPQGVVAHTHQVQPLPGGEALCVMDLGMDAIFLHPADDAMNPQAVRCVRTPQGCGPRHMAFSADGRFGYLCGELDNHVLVYRVGNDTLNQVQRIDALPQGWAETSYCGAIRISPDGRFLLVSNRGQDCVAVFAIGADGLLAQPRWYPCGGDFPRDMAFSPCGEFLLCANQCGGTVSVLRWEADDGNLTTVGSTQVPKPTSVLFQY